MSNDTLRGTVRVVAKGPFEGQVGVVDYYDKQTMLTYVRIGNARPIAFIPGELVSSVSNVRGSDE